MPVMNLSEEHSDMLVLVTHPSSMFSTYEPDSVARTPVKHKVREAVQADVESCVRIMMDREAGDPDRTRSRLRRSVESEAEGFFVAEIEGAVAGFGRVQLLMPPKDSPPNGVPLGWYLIGVMVDSRWRRRGLGDSLTRARLGWVQQRAHEVWYFANARNRASIDLHEKYGFVEVTRDFTVAGLTFDGGRGSGILFRAALSARN
jgi:ribosomal protein S18 acetylase RimI-like enzyme